MYYPCPDPAAHFTAQPIPRTNGFAIAALVLGIAGFGGLAGILGLIFGIIAKKKIDKNRYLYKGYNLATTGVVLGILSIIGTVLQVLFWAYILGS